MPAFAVQIEGLTTEEQARWVLAVDPTGERLLIAHEDQSLHWHPMGECKFARMRDPLAVQPVVVATPQGKGPQIVVPRNGGGL